METLSIDGKVTDVLADPATNRELERLMSEVAARHGVAATAPDLDRGARFVIGYIAQVSYMLKVAYTAANNVGLSTEMDQVLAMVKSYWEQDEDVIPDHLGVFGLLDDAYCSLTSLQAFSHHYQQHTGKLLFPEDLTRANRVMRRIIGDPWVSELDQLVTETIAESGAMQTISTLASEDRQRHLAARANIWNHGPAGEMPVEQLRGLGLETDAPD